MIVADTSALVSLATVDLLETTLVEFDVHTTETVLEEVEETAEYDDSAGTAADAVLEQFDQLVVHGVESEPFQSSRVDEGEGSCALLARERDAEFLLTDDLRALPELERVADSTVAISPIVLTALVKRDVLEQETAERKLDRLAEQRNWLGAPIYRRSKELLE